MKTPKTLQRIVAIVMTVVMLVGAVPSMAFAAIASGSAGLTMALSASAEKGRPGETVQVTVNVAENPGLASLKFNVEYDDVLTLTDISFNNEFGSMITAPEPYTNPEPITMIAPLADVYANGVFATLTFVISENAPDKYTANINITYDSADIFNGNEDPIELQVTNGSIYVFHTIPGDINGDNSVNTKDAIDLFRYIADWDIEVVEAALDINSDRTVNTKDAIALFRYIAGWNVEIGPIDPDVPSTHTHSLVAFEAKDATCTEKGNIAYWYCSECTKYFSDSAGKSEITLDNTVVNAKGHTEVSIPDVAPTYTEWGSKGGVKCSVCNIIITEPIPVKPLEKDELSIQYEYKTISGDTYLDTAVAKAISDGKIVTQETKATSNVDYTLPFIELNTIPGYEFQGWYSSTAADAEKVSIVKAGTIGTVKVYARWIKTQYTVTLKSSLVTVAPIKRTIDEVTLLPAEKNMVVPYYTFIGWSDASGRIIDQIEAGIGNITVYANYTSATRNVAIAEDYESKGPQVIFDEVNKQYLFVYSLGTIEKIPLKQLNENDWTLGGGEDSLTIEKQEFTNQTIGETEAKEINTTVANATTHSSSWTLSQDWNELITEMDGGNQSITEGTVVAISDGKSTAYSSEGSTYVGNSFHASTDSKVTSKTITDDSYKNSASLDASLGYGPAKVSASISGEQAHSEHQEDYSETNSALQNSAEWNTSSGYSASFNQDHTESRTQSVLETAQKEWKHEISKSVGGSSGKTNEETSSSSQTEGFVSTSGYYNETLSGVSITETRKFTTAGSYRYVAYGKVHVYAIVGYDIKTGAFFVNSVNALDDTITYGFDYSYDGSFTDYNNGVLPFEIPVDIYNYVYEKTAKSEGVVVNREGIVTDYVGTAKNVLIPDFVSFSNDDGSYYAVEVVGIAANEITSKGEEYGVFFNNADIKSVKFGSGIEAIPDKAFSGCASLESIKYNTLTAIGNDAFNGCTSFENIEVSKSVTSLGENAFVGVKNALVYASNTDVALNAVSSGAKNLSVYLEGLSADEIAKLSGNNLKAGEHTTELFAIYGNGKIYDNVSVESGAALTRINRMTFSNNKSIPLTIDSETVELFAVNIVDAPGLAVKLTEENTNVIITGVNNISTKGKTAILSKGLTVSLPASISETTNLNVTGGEILVCGSIDQLESFRYLNANKGIRSISETEYKNMVNSHAIRFDSNGGSAVESIEFMAGDKIDDLPVPTRSGCDFLGWYDADGNKFETGTVVNELSDITLKAHWLSDFVLETAVPEDATVSDGENHKKWTYDLTTIKTSDKSYEEGYTLYNTTSAWGEYGEWSTWSTSAVTSSDSRQVETNTVAAVYKTVYRYHRFYGYNSKCGKTHMGPTQSYWGTGSYCTCGGTYCGNVQYTDWLDAPLPHTGYAEGHASYTASGTGSWYHQETNQVLVSAAYTQYRYRDRELVYTYHHKKVEAMESLTEVFASDTISNIKKYVKYVID